MPTQAKPLIDFDALRQQVRMADVLQLVGVKITTLRADGARCPCPLHGSGPGSRSLSVELRKGMWRCVKCGQGGNLLDFYACVRQLPLYEAAIELAGRLGVELPTKPRMRSLNHPQHIWRRTEKRNP